MKIIPNEQGGADFYNMVIDENTQEKVSLRDDFPLDKCYAMIAAGCNEGEGYESSYVNSIKLHVYGVNEQATIATPVITGKGTLTPNINESVYIGDTVSWTLTHDFEYIVSAKINGVDATDRIQNGTITAIATGEPLRLEVTFTSPHEAEYLKITGGYIRLNTNAGLRFEGLVKKQYIDDLQTKYAGAEITFGMMMLPTENLPAGETLTVDSKGVQVQTATEENYKIYTMDDGTEYYQFFGTMSKIPVSKYEAEVSAGVFIKVVSNKGSEQETTEYIYSNVESRSIASVARTVSQTSEVYDKLTDYQKELLNAFMGISNEEEGTV